jgi:hypothetical protein
MNWTVIATYAKGTWAAVGPLVGVLIGAYISNRNQRKQRIADNKREEYRELLATLSKAITIFFRDRAGLLPNGTNRIDLLTTTSNNVMEAIQTRIYIASVMTRLQVLPRWKEALELPQNNAKDNSLFAQTAGRILEDVRNAAKEDLED